MCNKRKNSISTKKEDIDIVEKILENAEFIEEEEDKENINIPDKNIKLFDFNRPNSIKKFNRIKLKNYFNKLNKKLYFYLVKKTKEQVNLSFHSIDEMYYKEFIESTIDLRSLFVLSSSKKEKERILFSISPSLSQFFANKNYSFGKLFFKVIKNLKKLKIDKIKELKNPYNNKDFSETGIVCSCEIIIDEYSGMVNIYIPVYLIEKLIKKDKNEKQKFIK